MSSTHEWEETPPSTGRVEAGLACGFCGNEAPRGAQEITYTDSDRIWHFCSTVCQQTFMEKNPPLWSVDD